MIWFLVIFGTPDPLRMLSEKRQSKARWEIMESSMRDTRNSFKEPISNRY